MWWWCHHHIFQVFLVVGVVGSVKSMLSGYSLDAEFNSTSNELSQSNPLSSPNRNLSKNTGRYVKNTNKNVVFFFSSSKINKYYVIILTIVLLIFLGGLFWVEIYSNGSLSDPTIANCFRISSKQLRKLNMVLEPPWKETLHN